MFPPRPYVVHDGKDLTPLFGGYRIGLPRDVSDESDGGFEDVSKKVEVLGWGDCLALASVSVEKEEKGGGGDVEWLRRSEVMTETGLEVAIGVVLS